MDEETIIDKDSKFYIFEFTSHVALGGTVSSTLPEEEAKMRVQENLEETFGAGGVTIDEFREATEEEVEVLLAQIERSAAPQSALN